MERTDKTFITIVLALAVIIFSSCFVSSLEPNGANVTSSIPQTSPVQSPTSVTAQAGNVTELNIFGFSPTQTWQGYYGNITGTIQLTDAQSRVLYNWSLASPQGEIYASTNNSISWSSIQCFNFTATGIRSGVEAAGNTNLYGTNLSQLESDYGLDFDDVDGVDETFTYYDATGHDLFYASSQQFDAGECRSTRIYDSSGKGSQGSFEEVLLYEPSSTSVIFASLIDNNLLGFDNASHDFEMLVLENGHGADVTPSTYYFYVELE